jgi:oxygen-independent coproporphyrinogen-3 oxidase
VPAWPPRHVYVHVPFCARRCSYCDFSIAVRRDVDAPAFAADVARELAIRFDDAGPWTADTLYLGGGTPSRLGGDGLARLIDALRARIDLAPGAEVTIEANPDDATAGAAAAWRAAGVNRLSLGAQSFDAAVLAWMHRTHDARAIGTAVDAARGAGIDDLSLDLIFALPDEIDRSWDADLAAALALRPDHLSFYGLTIEPHTPLGRRHRRGEVQSAADERYEQEFLAAHDQLTSSGFEHYEVSNYARPGRRAAHNSAYWTGDSYAGIGPSAHEFDGLRRRWNVSPFAEWSRRVAAGTDVTEGSEVIDSDARSAETVYLGLRTTRGLALSEAETAHVRPWIDAGWAALTGDGQLVLNARGWLRLDALAADLTLLRSRY